MFLLIIYKRIYYENWNNRTTWSADVRNQTEPTMDGERNPLFFSRIFTDVWQENATREKRENIFLSRSAFGESKQSAVRWNWNFPDATNVQRCLLSIIWSFINSLNKKLDDWLKKKKSGKNIPRFPKETNRLTINQIGLCLQKARYLAMLFKH